VWWGLNSLGWFGRQAFSSSAGAKSRICWRQYKSGMDCCGYLSSYRLITLYSTCIGEMLQGFPVLERYVPSGKTLEDWSRFGGWLMFGRDGSGVGIRGKHVSNFLFHLQRPRRQLTIAHYLLFLGLGLIFKVKQLTNALLELLFVVSYLIEMDYPCISQPRGNRNRSTVKPFSRAFGFEFLGCLG
jgi:hypothetical protein